MSILAEYHNEVTLSTGAVEFRDNSDDSAAFDYDVASEVATSLLVATGHSPNTPDRRGNEVSDEVQTLLTLAFYLAPGLAGPIEDAINNGSINI